MSPPAPALRRFLRLCREGRYWESHEVLEEPWRESRDPFTQALILYASAWVHWERGNPHGVKAQLAKTLNRLAGVPGSHGGFDVDALREHCTAVIAQVVGAPDDWRGRVAPLPLRPPVAPAAGPVIVEACVTSVAEARGAVAAGAHRLELCRRLDVGGLTPEVSVVREVLGAVEVPVHILIRPAPRMQVSPDEVETMKADIEAVARAGAQGVVLGAVTAAGEVDGRVVEACMETVRRVGPGSRVSAGSRLGVTFHRAFDELADPVAGLTALCEAGVDRVLTSGGAATAWEGREALRSWADATSSGPTLMAGGRVRGDHVVALVDAADLTEVHARAEGVPGIVAALSGAGLLG